MNGDNLTNHHPYRHREWSIGNGSAVHHKSNDQRNRGHVVRHQQQRQDDPALVGNKGQYAIIEEQPEKSFRVQRVNKTNPEEYHYNLHGWLENLLENRTKK